MTELSDYKRMIEAPMRARYEERLAEQRGLVRDLTTVLEKRNAEIERLRTSIFNTVNDANRLARGEDNYTRQALREQITKLAERLATAYNGR